MITTGTLIFFCGKMGSGKSTKSKEIASEKNAVLLSEDEWLLILYPQQISSFDDYLRYSNLLKPLIRSHVQKILLTGTDVVLDFPANTYRQRTWFKNIVLEIDAKHQLIYLDISDEKCIKQIAQRRLEQPERSNFDTEEMFYQLAKFFETPIKSECLNITLIGENS